MVALKKSRYGPLVFDLLTLIRRHRIQILNMHGSLESWSGSIAGRLSRQRHVFIRARYKSTPISNNLRHRILYQKLPHTIIETGEAVRDELIRRQGVDPARIVSIPTGVDLEFCRPGPSDPTIRAQFGLSAQHLLVGTVAFFRHCKGLDYRLEAFKLVTQKGPEARFLLVGDGAEKEALRRKVKDLGFYEYAALTGYH